MAQHLLNHSRLHNIVLLYINLTFESLGNNKWFANGYAISLKYYYWIDDSNYPPLLCKIKGTEGNQEDQVDYSYIRERADEYISEDPNRNKEDIYSEYEYWYETRLHIFEVGHALDIQ